MVELDKLLKRGFMEKKVGESEVIYFNPQRDSEIKEMIAKSLKGEIA
jgi:hypothetical protein